MREERTALLKLADEVGEQSVAGARTDPGTPKRGWLAPLPAYPFPRDSAIFIVGHPEAKPLKLALDTKSVLATWILRREADGSLVANFSPPPATRASCS